MTQSIGGKFCLYNTTNKIFRFLGNVDRWQTIVSAFSHFNFLYCVHDGFGKCFLISSGEQRRNLASFGACEKCVSHSTCLTKLWLQSVHGTWYKSLAKGWHKGSVSVSLSFKQFLPSCALVGATSYNTHTDQVSSSSHIKGGNMPVCLVNSNVTMSEQKCKLCA